MKRTLIAILFATFLLSFPVTGDGRKTVKTAGEETRIAGTNTVVPRFPQIRRRYYRRRYRRAYIRRRYIRRRLVRHQRRIRRRRF